MGYQEEKKYVGNPEQLFSLQRVKREDGKAEGVSLIEVKNRSGMEFSVNISRGLDIPYLSFHGENIGYISPCGIVAPQYFDDKGTGFLKSFTAGFLTTCGLKTAGEPCRYGGEEYGLHGNISHTPSENVKYEIVESENRTYANICGTVRDAVIFGDRLCLERNIRCDYRKKKFVIRDTVKNEGYKKARHMILYHYNIGYPILSPESDIYIPSSKIIPRNAYSKQGIYQCTQPETPNPEYKEMAFYHTLIPDKKNWSTVCVFNPNLEIGVALKINLRTLDHFVQWKMMGAGDYVIGLEPGNTTIDGIENAIDNGSMKYLEPQENVEYEMEIQIIEGKEEFIKLKKSIKAE